MNASAVMSRPGGEPGAERGVRAMIEEVGP